MRLILYNTLTGAVLILAILLIRKALCKKVPAQFLRILWGAAVVRLLLPFRGNLFSSLYSRFALPNAEPLAASGQPFIQFLRYAGFIQDSSAVGTATETVMATAANTSSLLTAPTATTWVLILWLTGSAVLFLFFLAGDLRIWKSLSSSCRITSEWVEQWKQGHPLQRDVRVYLDKQEDSPFSIGLLRPAILLPVTVRHLKKKELLLVLEHEYVHIRRMDILWKKLVLLCACIHWFNPLVWIMVMRHNRDTELACDEEVVFRMGEGARKAYAHLLLSLDERSSSMLPVMAFGQDPLEERIRNIMRKKQRHGRAFPAVLIAACLFLMLGTGTMFFPDIAAEASENETKTVQEEWFPTPEYVAEYGYPVNENGQTYGPAIDTVLHIRSDVLLHDNPDLVLVEGRPSETSYQQLKADVVIEGYCVSDDLFFEYQPKNPEEAAEYSRKYGNIPRYLPVYRSDGETIIGVFRVN